MFSRIQIQLLLYCFYLPSAKHKIVVAKWPTLIRKQNQNVYFLQRFKIVYIQSTCIYMTNIHNKTQTNYCTLYNKECKNTYLELLMYCTDYKLFHINKYTTWKLKNICYSYLITDIFHIILPKWNTTQWPN